MVAAKIKGQGLTLTIGGKSVNLDASQIVLQPEEADTDGIVFDEYDGSTPLQWFFTITGRSDYASGSFWDVCWKNNGTDVPYLFKPQGNATASEQKPHWSGTCHITMKPQIGGSVGELFTYEVRWDCNETPTRVAS